MIKNNCDFKLISLDTVDSTNNYLKKLNIEENLEEYTVILSAYQESGRGQGKNSWHSKKGENLLASVLFKPSINVANHFSISEFISLGIVDTLAFYGIHPKIKWPNDIYVGNKKIAGILVENSIMGGNILQVVAGIGLNINEVVFPKKLPNPTSIRLQKDIMPIVSEVLTRLMSNLIKRYEFVSENKFEILHEEYNNLLYLKNKLATYLCAGRSFKAVIVGVGKSGELQNESGNIENYLFGEVQFIQD
jgi:BirA family biotin operon repressor/biotin-[acetyl-CoA-carboxylase] ligase